MGLIVRVFLTAMFDAASVIHLGFYQSYRSIWLKAGFIHGPWPLSLVGALMILLSTFILGVTTFGKERALAEVEKEARELEYKFQEVKEDSRSADLDFNLGYIQRSIVKFGVFQDADIQKAWDRWHAAILYSSVLKSRSAAGLEVTETLKELGSRAIQGDKDAFDHLHKMSIELTKASGEYGAKLIKGKAELENKTADMTSEIIKYREMALFLQITGLLLLLVKELPESMWKVREQKSR